MGFHEPWVQELPTVLVGMFFFAFHLFIPGRDSGGLLRLQGGDLFPETGRDWTPQLPIFFSGVVCQLVWPYTSRRFHHFLRFWNREATKRWEKVTFFQNECARMRVIQIACLAAFPKKPVKGWCKRPPPRLVVNVISKTPVGTLVGCPGKING